MTTLFVLGLAGMAAVVATVIGATWFAVRAALWVMFFPLMLLKAVFGMVFGLVFGILGLVFALVVGVVGLLALAAVVAVPLLPVLLVVGLVWLAVKGTTALAAA